MKDKTRKLGLDVLSEAPRGTHLCHFYDTKEDLIDTLVPYFKAGLENNEFCMWVTAEPLGVDDAKASLGEAVENLDDYIERGQIEILDYSQWYTRSGQFNADEVLQGWVEKLNQALHRGFDGLRLTGNTFWLEKRDWDDFAEYEVSVDNVIGKYRMLAICSYSLGKCGPCETIDVVRNHDFALARRHGTWEIFESTGRRRMKKKLYKKQELLDVILKSVPAMIWSKNAEGKYLQVNRAYCETVGLSEEKMLGRTDYDLYPENIATKYTKYDRQVIDSGQPISGIEERYLKPSGDYGRCLTEKLPYYDDKGNVVGTIGFALDITERKRAEEAQRESEEKYRGLINGMNDTAWVIDLDANFIDVNDAAVEGLGYSREELLSMGPQDIDTSIGVEEIKGLIEQIPTNEIQLFETTHTTKDGKTIPVEIKSSLVTYQGKQVILSIARDITERKLAEERLKEYSGNLEAMVKERTHELHRALYDTEKARDRIDGILKSVADGLIVTDAYNRVLLMNRSAEDLLGARLTVAVNRPIDFAIKDSTLREQIKRTLDKKGTGRQFDFELRGEDTKHSLILQARTSLIKDKEGKHAGTVTVIRNVTEDRRRAAETLRKSQEQLFQAQKMEAIGTLVSGVAHEINNPVNLIMFNIPLLQKIWRDIQPIIAEHAGKEPSRKYAGLTYEYIENNIGRLLSDIGLAADRIARIVTGLKDFARQSDVIEKKELRINEGVENAVRLARTTIKRSGIDLKLDLGHDLPPLQGNLQKIEQIILNLVLNAVEAIDHDRGKIKIVTVFNKRDSLICFKISDNGRGIDPSISDRIFDPFVTDRQAEGGTGLGLSVTYSLVKAHNGEITFQSERGKGTTFTVSFSLKKKGANILVVDDDKEVRHVVTEALAMHGAYEVDEASNGTEALIKLGTHHPDLLILDIFMPEMDGLEVCRIIKREPELSGIKVIIITGFPDHPTLKKVAALGFANIYTKPLRLPDLVREVDSILKSEED